MRYIDLRSDTVTQPTPAMREAMAKAVVGDDVFDDDPTIKELEALAADKLGKEAALFVTSGTQGNAVSLMALTRRGEAIIMARDCHVATHENGSYAMLSGACPCYAEDDGGVLRPESIEALIRGDDDLHVPPTGLICVENALSNGGVAPMENLRRIYAIAKSRNLPVHLDGARLFNAAAYLGVDVKMLTENCDSVMCCLSKGLCAPVGSVVAGSIPFIRRAKRMRKILGGGMRQAGVLAAAGKLALTEMTGRVAEDYENAKYLAGRLAELPGVTIDVEAVKINMVFFTVYWPERVLDSFPEKMLALGIKTLGGRQMRFVTSHDVTRTDCDTVIAAMAQVLRETGHA